MLVCAVLFAVVLGTGISYSPWTVTFSPADQATKSHSPVTDTVHLRSLEPTAGLSPDAPMQLLPELDILPVGQLTMTAGRPAFTAVIARTQEIESDAPGALSATAGERTAPDPQNGNIDCRLAKARGAMALCSNANLATIDREYALLYGQSWRQANAAKRALISRARQRLAAHRDACPTDACTSAVYLAAMRELSAIMTAKTAAAVPLQPKPSFSCRFASTAGQRAVCGDPNLSALDRHQALLYSQSWGRADAAKRERLLRAHNRLVAGREKCETGSCTKDVYVAALSEITGIMSQQ